MDCLEPTNRHFPAVGTYPQLDLASDVGLKRELQTGDLLHPQDDRGVFIQDHPASRTTDTARPNSGPACIFSIVETTKF